MFSSNSVMIFSYCAVGIVIFRWMAGCILSIDKLDEEMIRFKGLKGNLL